MSRARLHHGWIVAPYDGPDRARVHIAVGATPQHWQPAYLAWDAGQRVAQIRPPAGRGLVSVWLRVDGGVTAMGRVQL